MSEIDKPSEWKVTKAEFDENTLSVQFIHKHNPNQRMFVQYSIDMWLQNIHAAWHLGELRTHLEPVKRLLEGRQP